MLIYKGIGLYHCDSLRDIFGISVKNINNLFAKKMYFVITVAKCLLTWHFERDGFSWFRRALFVGCGDHEAVRDPR